MAFGHGLAAAGARQCTGAAGLLRRGIPPAAPGALKWTRGASSPPLRRASSTVARFKKAKVEELIECLQHVRTEEEFLGVVTQAGELAPELAESSIDFYQMYKAALSTQQGKYSEEFIVRIQAALARQAFKQIVDPYKFPSYHEREDTDEGGFNFHQFGQDFTHPLIDWQRSMLGPLPLWEQIEAQIAAGENVVLLSNHQIEPDPNVLIHLLNARFPKVAEELAFVAGARVTTDPVAVPFSRGHNLFCVHSRKHLDDVADEREAKTAQNRATLRAIHHKMVRGGNIIWIAPSGGRDRPVEGGSYVPAPFDPAPVGVMYLTAQHAKRKTHFYPLAMYTHAVMPPPRTVDKKLGEKREMGLSPVGVRVGEELDLPAIAAAVTGTEDDDAFIKALAAEAEWVTTGMYFEMESHLLEGTPDESWQPWLAATSQEV